MSTKMQIAKAQLGELSLLFGPPPVLSTEDLKLYDQMWKKLTECLKPVDMMELLLIRRIHDETWLVCRYSRHKALVVDRRFRESLEFQLKRTKEQKARREALARELAEKTGRPISELARLEDLEDTIESSVADVDQILERTPTEFDHNRALEAGIVFIEQLDKLINSATARRNDALEQLELYQMGLGERLRQRSDEIIDAAGNEVDDSTRQIESPPLVPGRESSAVSPDEGGTPGGVSADPEGNALTETGAN